MNRIQWCGKKRENASHGRGSEKAVGGVGGRMTAKEGSADFSDTHAVRRQNVGVVTLAVTDWRKSFQACGIIEKRILAV